MRACRVSLTGYCPKMSLWQEHVPREGWMCDVWVPEALAHVYHSDAWNDQPNFVYRYTHVFTGMQIFSCCQSFTGNPSQFLFSVLNTCEIVVLSYSCVIQAHITQILTTVNESTNPQAEKRYIS